MAETVPIPGTSQQAKIREPVAPWLLGVVTLGIYHDFWWYYINYELRHLGEGKDEPGLGKNPVLSVLALIFAWLVVPGIWTIVTTTRRIQRAQRLVGVNTTNGWIAGLLWIFTLGIGGLIYTQSGMNRIWRGVRDRLRHLQGNTQTLTG